MKIQNDKYYTDNNLAKQLIDTTFNILGTDNICEIIEPSAGNGSFSLQLPTCKAYDIEPEHNTIIKQDYLKLDIEYLKGRLIIGNPPFGNRMNLALQFFKKSVQIADYIAFILPISQLNNTISLYQFDLIYSIDLGLQSYSGRKIHCCFNIYKRPAKGLNCKPDYNLKEVNITGVSRGRVSTLPTNYDLCVIGFGRSAGKECEGKELQYCEQIYININNIEYKQKIKELILNTKWFEMYPPIGTKRLKIWQLYKHIKETYPKLN